MPKLILDVMGGDDAPRSPLEGALLALPDLKHELILIGDEKKIHSFLSKRRFRPLQNALSAQAVQLIHAPDTIEMKDSIRSIRTKPQASINVGCRLIAQDWPQHPSVFISAGHSGAVMASALLHLGRLSGVERPAIAVKLPTLSEDGCVLLDVGANVDCKAEHLRDFAIMGALFAQVERQKSSLPQVAILSNGEEMSKGNELTRAAAAWIEKMPCFQKGHLQQIGHFIGYIEGKEIFKGQVDAVITDGFVGNVVLKSIEGLGSAVVSILKKEAKYNPINALGFLLSASVLRRLKQKLDYAEYGAAPLLGVAGYVFVCHGRSNSKAIKNALLRSQAALQSRFVERMEAALLEAKREGT